MRHQKWGTVVFPHQRSLPKTALFAHCKVGQVKVPSSDAARIGPSAIEVQVAYFCRSLGLSEVSLRICADIDQSKLHPLFEGLVVSGQSPLSA